VNAAEPSTDAGAPFTLLPVDDSTTQRPSTWRTKVAAALLLAGLGYHIYSERSEAKATLMKELISCEPTEVHDLINVFHFTTSDMESLYARAMRLSVMNCR
jgi:hypothetical protein